MDKQHIVYRVASRALIAASLLAVAYATASAQGTVGPPPVISPEVATLAGTVSVTRLSASQANREALQAGRNAQPVEMPKHRLPDGSLTSALRSKTLKALPLTPEPNAGVEGGIPSPLERSVSIIDGFTGIVAGENEPRIGFELEPPDQGLAVHDNVVAEINNLLLQFFKSDGTPLTNPISASAFFLAPFGASLSDPQAFFDPRSKRWFFDIILSEGFGGFNGFGLAVSKTSDPLGEYFIYHINAITRDMVGCFIDGDFCFPDYPKAGYNADAFFITADLFECHFFCGFIGTAVYVLPKKKLEAGADFTHVRFDRHDDFVVQPSVPAPGEPFATANGGTEYLLTARNIVDGSNNVRVIAIYNTGQIVSSPGNLQQISVDVAAELYGPTVPSTQPNVIGPFCTSRGVTSAPLLDGGYNAFQATIQKAGGNLYAVLAFGATDGNGLDRDVLAWFILQPTLTSSPSLTANIIAQNYVVPPNGYSMSYPAFAVNKAGVGVIGATITNPDPNVAGGFPSASFIRFSGFPRGNITVTGQGATSDDGFTGCPFPGFPGQIGRWGDYGAATVDAASGFYYLANEYIPNPKQFPRGFATNWGTFITRVH
jgi:hypothetical protein